MSLDFIRVEVPELYPYVLLAAGTISFQCLLIGFGAGGKRKTIFDHDKIKAKYGEEHQKNFKCDPPKGGYPDHGDGLYGDMLSYKDWYEFTLDQRGHKNFLEQVTIIVFLLLVIGMVYPILSLVFAGINFVARWVFVCGYKKGPNWRLIGGLPINLTLFAMQAMAIVACSVWISQIPKA